MLIEEERWIKVPQISVIVPVYKVEKYINRCVDSILTQTFTDFEVILVDDGSPDSCGTICNGYAEKDNRVVVIHQKNEGLSAARNTGIEWAFANSNSEWLTFIDSDDWVHPKYLEALFDGAKQTGLDVVIGGYERTVGENPTVDENALTATVWDTEQFYVEKNVNATVAWGKLYRKNCFLAIRYPVGKIHEDEFVTYRILFEFDKLAVIQQPLYAYYQNPNGIMGSTWSPKKLVKLDALIQQSKFFKRRKYSKAYSHTGEVYCWNVFEHLEAIKKNQELEKEYGRVLRKKLRYMLKEYKSRFPFENQNLWIYELAYPKEMWFYWFLKAKLGKFSKEN